MEFYTSFSQKRPVRLCEQTRQFAYRSLYEHKYGLDTSDKALIPDEQTVQNAKDVLTSLGVNIIQE